MKEVTNIFRKLNEDIYELFDEVLNRRFDFHTSIAGNDINSKIYSSYEKKRTGSESSAIYI